MTVEQAIPYIIGILVPVLGVLDFLIRRWFHRRHDTDVRELSDQIVALQFNATTLRTELDKSTDQAATRTSERDEARAEVNKLTEENAELTIKRATQDIELSDLNDTKDTLEKGQKAHDNRIRRALKMEGAIWTQPVMAGTPPFRPLAERRTPIVSVLNLKGGVGKTTLTAYLAWALSARGYRVLLIDLDLQGSLSSLFVPTEELAPRLAKHEHKLLQHYLADVAEKKPAKLLDFTLPLPQLNQHSRLVATTDRLAYAELSQTVQWLLRVGGTGGGWNGRHDGRMILRRALHAKGLAKKFDVILMDCPPLVNLCCANALAASDYVLAPVMPSVKSVERVAPLLQRVMEVKKSVNPELHMLGLVVNSTQERDLTPREQDLLLDLPALCLTVYGEDVYKFDTHVPQRVAIREAEVGFSAPDEKHPLRTTFEALAEEFIKRLRGVCRQPEERARKWKTMGEI